MAEKKKVVAKKATAKKAVKATKVAKKDSKKVVEKEVVKAPKAAAPVLIHEKKKIIETFAVHNKDTGSAQVQVAILTSRIDSLQSHLKDHPKDNHSRKGLLAMVGKRRKHLDYLKDRKADEYEKLIKELGLRK